MNKESWKSVKEVSLVTAAGTAEGALIGFSVGGPGGALVMGGVGLATALTAEITGRMHKQDITVAYTLNKEPLTASESPIVQSKEMSFAAVPTIKQADTILGTLPTIMRDIYRPLREFKTAHLAVSRKEIHRSGITEVHTRSMDLVFPPKI